MLPVRTVDDPLERLGRVDPYTHRATRTACLKGTGHFFETLSVGSIFLALIIHRFTLRQQKKRQPWHSYINPFFRPKNG